MLHDICRHCLSASPLLPQRNPVPEPPATHQTSAPIRMNFQRNGLPDTTPWHSYPVPPAPTFPIAQERPVALTIERHPIRASKVPYDPRFINSPELTKFATSFAYRERIASNLRELSRRSTRALPFRTSGHRYSLQKRPDDLANPWDGLREVRRRLCASRDRSDNAAAGCGHPG